MKAIISIELDIDGEWHEEHKERLVEMILENPGNYFWEIEEDRLTVLPKYITAEVVE